MPDRSQDYRPWLLKKLANPVLAANYLNTALDDSPEMFLKAMRNVAQARQMSRVAKESGVTRENLYRALSDGGNPTFGTLNSVLTVMGLKIAIETQEEMPENLSSVTSSGDIAPKRRRAGHKKH